MEAAGDPVVGDPHELDVAREHRVAQDCSPERIADRGDERNEAVAVAAREDGVARL